MKKQIGVTSIFAILVCGVLSVLATPHALGSSDLRGVVKSGSLPLRSVPVTLHRAGGASGTSTPLARGVTNRRGRFMLGYRAPRSRNVVLYLTAGRSGGVKLATVLGPRPGKRAVLNELTTVAAGFGMAQFINGAQIAGPWPGPQNAALMARNLAHPATGKVSPVLSRSPNGNETSTMSAFLSIANMLPACVRHTQRCRALFNLASEPAGARPRGVLQAIANIARYPWQNARKLYQLSAQRPAPYTGALSEGNRRTHWMLPVRFVGDGRSVDGPGNFAIDARGNIYVANNYEFGRSVIKPRCGSNLLPKFRPDGRYPAGSPFEGGGLSGAGYGITLDPKGRIWVGNFGFAAPGCPEDRQPPHNTLSAFLPDGTALSENGFDGRPRDAGPEDPYPFNWPQGTISDQGGTIWAANCGDGKVVRMSGDDPYDAKAFDVGLEQAFDVAVDHDGLVYATGLGNSKLAILNPDGTPRPGSPLEPADAGLDRPMGIAADSRGNMWIANSGLINLPCPPPADVQPKGQSSISLIAAGGHPVTSGDTGFTGGGLTLGWGIAVDGNDNVWVSNFARKRISHFCGTKRKECRPGASVGSAISPGRTGYNFDGMTRSTAVEIDPSGNVWATNNWKQAPVQSNPGGYEVVAFVGAAAPLRTPLIGPPRPLIPDQS